MNDPNGRDAAVVEVNTHAPAPWRLSSSMLARVLVIAVMIWLDGCSTEEPVYRTPEFRQFMYGYAEDPGASTLPSSPVSTPARSATRPSIDPADPPASDSAAVTLSSAIEECLKHNLAIQSSTEDVNQSRADLWTASLYPNPQLTVDTSLQPFGRGSLRPTNPAGPPQYDATLEYPIDWLLFGKRAAAIEVAKQAVNSAAATHADQIRQQVSAAISSFYDVLEAKSSLALAQEDLRQSQQLLEITGKRVQNGGVGNVELDRVRVRVITARQAVDQQERALVASKSTLRALLGRAQPDQSFDVVGTLDVPSNIPALEVKDLLRQAASNRPDLLALEYKLRQTKADVSNQELQAYPQVALSGVYTFQEQQPIGAKNVDLWGASVQASIPLFDRNQGNIRKAHSAALQALTNYSAQVVQASSEIEQALDAFNAAHHILAENGALLVESAKNARDKMQKGYELGGYALLDILDAQAAYRDALRTDLALRLDYWRSLHKVNAAVGTQVLH